MLAVINTCWRVLHKAKLNVSNHNFFNPGAGLGWNIFRDARLCVFLCVVPGDARPKKMPTDQSIAIGSQYRVSVRWFSRRVAEIALQVFASFRQ
jgi:hypothetical protein